MNLSVPPPPSVFRFVNTPLLTSLEFGIAFFRIVNWNRDNHYIFSWNLKDVFSTPLTTIYIAIFGHVRP